MNDFEINHGWSMCICISYICIYMHTYQIFLKANFNELIPKTSCEGTNCSLFDNEHHYVQILYHTN